MSSSLHTDTHLINTTQTISNKHVAASSAVWHTHLLHTYLHTCVQRVPPTTSQLKYFSNRYLPKQNRCSNLCSVDITCNTKPTSKPQSLSIAFIAFHICMHLDTLIKQASLHVRLTHHKGASKHPHSCAGRDRACRCQKQWARTPSVHNTLAHRHKHPVNQRLLTP